MTDYTIEIRERADYCDRTGMNGTAHILREYADLLERAPAEPAHYRRYIDTLRDWRRGDNVQTETFNAAIDAAIAALQQPCAPAVTFRPVSDEDVSPLPDVWRGG